MRLKLKGTARLIISVVVSWVYFTRYCLKDSDNTVISKSFRLPPICHAFLCIRA